MATAAKTPRKKKAVKEVDPNAPPAEPKAKRTRKAAAEPRIKLYWGVFNQSLKRVAVFEYEDLKKAEKAAKEFSKAGGVAQYWTPWSRAGLSHYVQRCSWTAAGDRFSQGMGQGAIGGHGFCLPVRSDDRTVLDSGHLGIQTELNARARNFVIRLRRAPMLLHSGCNSW